MTQTFTLVHDDVIRYLYNETSTPENEHIEEELLLDNNLLDFYLDCLNLKSGLNEIRLEPSQQVVNRILSFSANYKPEN
jgi:hypothetical protein